MKKTSLVFVALIALTGVAQAYQMSYSDNREGTIIQTYTTPENFSPASPSLIPIEFKQFNTEGGKLTLSSVTVSITQKTWGGSFEADNDSSLGGLANGTVSHGISGKITVTVDNYYFLPSGSGVTLASKVSRGVNLLADDDVSGSFERGGDDYAIISGTAKDDALSASASGAWGTGHANLAAYQGTGNLSMDYEVTQSSGYAGTGALAYSGVYANSSALITVTYNYTPEPTSLALLAIGCAVVGMRRRNRHTLKA